MIECRRDYSPVPPLHCYWGLQGRLPYTICKRGNQRGFGSLRQGHCYWQCVVYVTQLHVASKNIARSKGLNKSM